MPTSHVFLSIIFPAYNEEGRIVSTLKKTISFLDEQSYSYEILVIENGSQDRTYEVASELIPLCPSLRVIHEIKRGKGLAVKRGMLEAVGEYRFICDVDLSMPIEQVNNFLPPNKIGEITIASREAPGAIRYNEPEYRHIIGRIFNLLVRVLALPGLHDSQCGFKCFSARAAEMLFPYQTITGWTFDVEILYVARKLGFSINELGILWYHDTHSKIKVVKDSFQMLLDLIRIRWNDLRGKYEKKV